MNSLKLVAVFILLICFRELTCAQTDSIKVKIKQPTVRGTIVLPNVAYNIMDFNYSRSIEDTIGIFGASIDIGPNMVIDIVPTTIGLEEEWQLLKDGDTPVKAEKRTDDYVIFQNINGNIKTYHLLVYKKWKTKAFLLIGGPQTENSLSTLAIAQQMLKIAQSFQPKE